MNKLKLTPQPVTSAVRNEIKMPKLTISELKGFKIGSDFGLNTKQEWKMQTVLKSLNSHTSKNFYKTR